jgi:hypothetical protein
MLVRLKTKDWKTNSWEKTLSSTNVWVKKLEEKSSANAINVEKPATLMSTAPTMLAICCLSNVKNVGRKGKDVVLTNAKKFFLYPSKNNEKYEKDF